MSRKNRNVVRTLPTSTMNITGFFAWRRGSSFTKLSRIARRTIFGSNIARARRFEWCGSSLRPAGLERLQT